MLEEKHRHARADWCSISYPYTFTGSLMQAFTVVIHWPSKRSTWSSCCVTIVPRQKWCLLWQP